MKKKCPTCNSSDGVRLIIWGMPLEEPDESRYYIGGCVVEDSMPDFKCVECGWLGSSMEKKPKPSLIAWLAQRVGSRYSKGKRGWHV